MYISLLSFPVELPGKEAAFWESSFSMRWEDLTTHKISLTYFLMLKIQQHSFSAWPLAFSLCKMQMHRARLEDIVV